jgi:hypothetical protein
MIRSRFVRPFVGPRSEMQDRVHPSQQVWECRLPDDPARDHPQLNPGISRHVAKVSADETATTSDSDDGHSGLPSTRLDAPAEHRLVAREGVLPGQTDLICSPAGATQAAQA